MTVNKALSQLAKSGLIERRRRSGSFVARPRSQAAILEIHDIKAEVQALGRPYRYELVARALRRATPPTGSASMLPTGSSVVELSCRHFAGKKPFCLEERLISLAAVPEARERELRRDRARTVAARPRAVECGRAHDPRHRRRTPRLRLRSTSPKGSACLVVERRTWSADQPVTMCASPMPATATRWSARFAPS